MKIAIVTVAIVVSLGRTSPEESQVSTCSQASGGCQAPSQKASTQGNAMLQTKKTKFAGLTGKNKTREDSPDGEPLPSSELTVEKKIASQGGDEKEVCSQAEIAGSDRWWTCWWHSHMWTCGDSCCCDSGYSYNTSTEYCEECEEAVTPSLSPNLSTTPPPKKPPTLGPPSTPEPEPGPEPEPEAEPESAQTPLPTPHQYQHQHNHQQHLHHRRQQHQHHQHQHDG